MGCQRTNPPPDTGLETLRGGAGALGIAFDEAALAAFQRYYELLAEHGSQFNLTAVRRLLSMAGSSQPLPSDSARLAKLK